MKAFGGKRKSMSSLDELLRATATGTEKANAIDKALNTPSDRILKQSIVFAKPSMINPADLNSNDEEHIVLKASVDAEIEAARKLMQLGIKILGRCCHVEPIPPAYLKCQKIHKNN